MLEPISSDEPVIEFVHNLLHQASAEQVSDIHIEPFEKHCRIRFRHDGLLNEITSIPLAFAERIISRLKIMSRMNIAEHRIPQDGRIQLQRRNKIDIRVSTWPTMYGEKMVLRMLLMDNTHHNIHNIGLSDAQKALFIEKLSQSQGLILVTGPTGSGKTVTLYAALRYLNQIEKNIITIEDPVEIELPGINQTNILPKIGFDFAAALRSLLRQDPDIIMIGEIRDSETAKIAMQAAQTGHLVLSTLHTNSASETLLRFQSMGIHLDYFIHSISLVISQRLVRCNSDKGRTGVFELLPNLRNE